MLRGVFTSNLDENESNLLLSCHIVLTMCSVLLSPTGFDRKKDFRSDFKEEQRFGEVPKNRRQDRGFCRGKTRSEEIEG